MSTEENQPGDPATGTAETAGQNQQGQQDNGKSETPPKPEAPQQAPAEQQQEQAQEKDPAKVALLADLRTERDKRQAAVAEVETLRTQLAEATTAKDAAVQAQARYDRLEEFLSKAGGPLARALDSRSLTTALFESDQDVQEIVTDWQKANPTATSQALGSGSVDPGGKKPGMNDLFRSAAK